MDKLCRKCKEVLKPGINWGPRLIRKNDYICKTCYAARKSSAAALLRQTRLEEDREGTLQRERERTRKWRLADPLRDLDVQIRKYGINHEEYYQLLEKQHNQCALVSLGGCRNNARQKRLSVDHSKVTGRIRGLLCDKHNRGLGFLGDSVEGLKRAIQYLEHGAVS